LTAEEIAQRREMLKQRLAEKQNEQQSQDGTSVTSELLHGNIDCFCLYDYFLNFPKTIC